MISPLLQPIVQHWKICACLVGVVSVVQMAGIIFDDDVNTHRQFERAILDILVQNGQMDIVALSAALRDRLGLKAQSEDSLQKADSPFIRELNKMIESRHVYNSKGLVSVTQSGIHRNQELSKKSPILARNALVILSAKGIKSIIKAFAPHL